MKVLQILKAPIMPFVYLTDRIIHYSDEFYIRNFYKFKMGKKLNLANPQTFNEKLQWLKLYDRKDIYTTIVDKCEAKEYVAKLIGNEYVIPTLGVYDSFDEIDFDKLPNQFVIKCTHNSGGIVAVKDRHLIDLNQLKRQFEKELKKNFYYYGREWPYKNVKPRIIIEQYMGENLNDYKIFCFNGNPQFTLVCSNRKGNNKNTDFYDNDWHLLPFTRSNHVNNPQGIKKPNNFKTMLNIAKKLSHDLPFIRVDLYEINNKVFFGELTFYPSSGFEGFNPIAWDKKIGDMLDLSMVKTNEK